MSRYEVSAPPDICLLESDDLEECGAVAALNAKLSGEVIVVLENDVVVGIGLPPDVKVHSLASETVQQSMSVEAAYAALMKKT